jgi:hypothetical protein
MYEEFDPNQYAVEIQDLVRLHFGSKWVLPSSEE